MLFMFNRFTCSICQSEGSIFSLYPFLKTILFFDQYVVSMQMLAYSNVHSFLEYL